MRDRERERESGSERESVRDRENETESVVQQERVWGKERERERVAERGRASATLRGGSPFGQKESVRDSEKRERARKSERACVRERGRIAGLTGFI